MTMKTTFRYKAVGPDGAVTEGVMDAGDRKEVAARLHEAGCVPIRAEPVGDGWLAQLLARRLDRAPRNGAKLMIGLFQQLETLLRAGVPLDRALELLLEHAEEKTEQRLLAALFERVRGGDSLSDAMTQERLFPAFCIGMVRAGEAGGSLESSVGELARQLDRNMKARERFQSALLYPVIVMLACGLSFVFLFTFIVPRFGVFFADGTEALPWVSRAVLATGGLFERFGWAIALAVVAAALLALHHFRLPANRQRWADRLLAVPGLGGLIVKAETARFCRVLGVLLRNGVTLTHGLEIAAQTFRHTALAAAVREAGRQVREGQGLAPSLLQTGAFPPFALKLLRVGEEAARLDEVLIDVADAYDRETERDTERLLALLGPALTIVLGALVALVIGSILVALLGTYQLTF